MATISTTAVADWLIDGARSAEKSQDVMAALCDRLVGCGIPLWRAAVFVRTLHPQVTGRRFLWRKDQGVEVSELLFERLQTPEFQDSPVARVYACDTAIRRRFVGDRDEADFTVLRDLRAEEYRTTWLRR